MYAADTNINPEIGVLLLKAGAEATAKDNDGRMAIDYARHNARWKGTDIYWVLNDAKYR
jgi:hypothetical protein